MKKWSEDSADLRLAVVEARQAADRIGDVLDIAARARTRAGARLELLCAASDLKALLQDVTALCELLTHMRD